jgi:hypothetical protein
MSRVADGYQECWLGIGSFDWILGVTAEYQEWWQDIGSGDWVLGVAADIASGWMSGVVVAAGYLE